jgi:type III secretory pathway lipoprotein EscJ
MTEVDLIKKYLLPNSVRIPLIKEIIERAVRTVRYTVIFSVPLKYAYTHSYTRQEHAPYTTHTLSPALCHVHPNVTKSIHPMLIFVFVLIFVLIFFLIFVLICLHT